MAAGRPAVSLARSRKSARGVRLVPAARGMHPVHAWAALALVIALRLHAYYRFPIASEDAYISFHAALDPAWHRAVTSPLWTLLLSPLGHPDILARIWTLGADVVCVWAASRVLKPLGFWAFCALWVSPFFTGSAVSGLETHIVAAAMILSRVHPIGYTIAAALRPDMAVLSLVASGRRFIWALAGCAVMLWLNLAFTGSPIPQTITSKALTYGIHPGAWGWLIPQGFGWMSLALLPAAMSKARLHVLAAGAFLLAHVILGTPSFWWYAAPSLAMLGLAACEAVSTRPRLMIALGILACFWTTQAGAVIKRTDQEAKLWKAGKDWASMHPKGTMLLEPAGMIPYLNPQLKVIDDVGLIDPWMAERRKLGRGWRTDAIARYKPDYVVVRLREYVQPDLWYIGESPYYDDRDKFIPGYGGMMTTDVPPGTTGKIRVQMVSANLIFLRKRH